MKARIFACLVAVSVLLPSLAAANEAQDKEKCLRKWEKLYYEISLKEHPKKEERLDAAQQLINDHKAAEEACNRLETLNHK